MKSIVGVLVMVSGCWQMTFYVGPRMDAEGVVGIEVGASMGAAAPIEGSAITTSIDSSGVYPRRAPPPGLATGAAARSIKEPSGNQPLIGMIRGVVEFTDAPIATERFVRTPGLGWRAGFYGGVAVQEDRALRPLVGVQAALSPFVWGLDDAGSKQFIAFGVQFGTEAVPGDDIFVMRAALTCDMQFLPRRW